MLRLTCPALWAQRLIRQGQRAGRELNQRWLLTFVKHPNGDDELLVRSPEPADKVSPEDISLRVFWVEQLPADPPPLPPNEAGLWITPQGSFCGHYQPPPIQWVRWPHKSINELWLPGAGLNLLFSANPGRLTLRPGKQQGGSRLGWMQTIASSRSDNGRDSRTAGAIGWSGVETLKNKDFGLVACGRNGTAMAMQLAPYEPYGIGLIDPQVVEAGNLDAGMNDLRFEQEPESLGTALKVDVLGDRLAQQAPRTRVTRLARDIQDPSAMRMLGTYDVIISATDNDLGRMSSAAVAASYQRVHLDLGSQVTTDENGERLLGADIRLTIPGDRDLCCLGGFAQGASLEAYALHKPMAAPTDWRANKSGALNSWAGIVAGIAMRLLEDLAAERITRSVWIRVTQAHGQYAPVVQELTAPPDPYCPLCAISGRGDEFLHRMTDLAAAAVVRAKRRGEMESSRS